MNEVCVELRYLLNRRRHEQALADGDNGLQLAFRGGHAVHFALRFATWQAQRLPAFRR
jgi:hypothetical protein